MTSGRVPVPCTGPVAPALTNPQETFVDLGDIFDENDIGGQRMMQLLMDDSVSEITANGHANIFFVGPRGKVMIRDRVFAGPVQYTRWLNRLLAITDVGFCDVETAQTHVIEGSFVQGVRGSIHICTK